MIGFWALTEREILRFTKVINQTILPPIISAILYLFIFGYSLRERIPEVQGISYLEFLVPGLVMMGLMNNAYSNTSSSLFIGRWTNSIQDVLVSPLSYWEMVLAYTIGGVARGLVVAVGVYLVALPFTSLSFISFPLTLFFLLMVSLIFSLIGLIAGLWAEKFEHIAIFTTFLITPLTFLGGVFYSVQMLPPLFQQLSLWNPFLYMINGLRFGMSGLTDVPLWQSVVLVSALTVGLFLFCVYLFRQGWKLRT